MLRATRYGRPSVSSVLEGTDFSLDLAMLDLARQLDDLESRGLLRQRRVVEGADGPLVTVDGRQYLAFCSNDYLGLAQHPALVEAVRRGAERYGVGTGASALISGHTR